MFRVPIDTVLRRASVSSLLVIAATALAACGDDTGTSGTADSQSSEAANGAVTKDSPNGTSTRATTPGTSPDTSKAPAEPTALKGTETDEEVPGGIKAQKFSPEDTAKITDHFEDAATIAKESAKKYTKAQTNAQVAEVKKVFKAAGQDVESFPAGEGGSVAILKSGGIRVMFFESDRDATETTRNYQQLISTRPGYGRADHFGSRMWILVNAHKITDSDLTAYRKIRARVEKEV